MKKNIWFTTPIQGNPLQNPKHNNSKNSAIRETRIQDIMKCK